MTLSSSRSQPTRLGHSGGADAAGAVADLALRSICNAALSVRGRAWTALLVAAMVVAWILAVTYLVAFVEIPISGLVAIMECLWLGLLVLQAAAGQKPFLNFQEFADANPPKGPRGSGSR